MGVSKKLKNWRKGRINKLSIQKAKHEKITSDDGRKKGAHQEEKQRGLFSKIQSNVRSRQEGKGKKVTLMGRRHMKGGRGRM